MNISKDEWINKILVKYEIKNPHVPKSEIDHVIEWLNKTSEKITLKMSFEQALVKANKWTEQLNKKNPNNLTPGNTELVIPLENGYKFVHLKDQNSKDWEGYYMSHCVASYTEHDGIYSLRDANDMPHCTIEIRKNFINQIKGRNNGPIKPFLFNYILKFLEHFNYEVSEREIENLGYEFLDEECFKILKNFYTGLKMVYINDKPYVYCHNKITLVKDHNYQDSDLFIFFMRKGDIDNIDYLVNNGMDLHIHNEGILKYAIEKGKIKLVKYLLDKGADVNIENGIILTKAILYGNIDVVKYLLDKRAIVLDKHINFARGKEDIIKLLNNIYEKTE